MYLLFAGKLYNEIGLLYAKCFQYAKAKTCFELALPLVRSKDKGSEAVILQNIGAIYNGVEEYQTALDFHEKAATLHG